MQGAILGDIMGSVWEEIPLKRSEPGITDDSVLTCAAFTWVQGVDTSQSDDFLRLSAIEHLKNWFKGHERVGFSKNFTLWAKGYTTRSDAKTNGALMRQSPIIAYCVQHNVSWWQCMRLVSIFASATHNHPEVHIAALGHAQTLYRALSGEITSIEGHHITLEEWRAATRDKFIWDARDSWAIAQSCLHYATSFSSAIDNCIRVGGDTDTYAAIAGPIAQALWGLDDCSYEAFIRDEKILGVYQQMKTA